jgi:hypothetical protein
MDSQVSIFVVLAELGQFPSILTSYFFREVLMPQVVQPGAVFRDGGGGGPGDGEGKERSNLFHQPFDKIDTFVIIPFCTADVAKSDFPVRG